MALISSDLPRENSATKATHSRSEASRSRSAAEIALAGIVEQFMVEQEARQVRRLAIEAAAPYGKGIELTGEGEFHAERLRVLSSSARRGEPAS